MASMGIMSYSIPPPTPFLRPSDLNTNTTLRTAVSRHAATSSSQATGFEAHPSLFRLPPSTCGYTSAAAASSNYIIDDIFGRPRGEATRRDGTRITTTHRAPSNTGFTEEEDARDLCIVRRHQQYRRDMACLDHHMREKLAEKHLHVLGPRLEVDPHQDWIRGDKRIWHGLGRQLKNGISVVRRLVRCSVRE